MAGNYKCRYINLGRTTSFGGQKNCNADGRCFFEHLWLDVQINDGGSDANEAYNNVKCLMAEMVENIGTGIPGINA